MRKLLLAATAAAMVGGLVASANAQTPPPSPAVNLGIPGWVYAPFTSPPGPTPLPGTLQAYFRGLIHADAALVSSSGSNYLGGKVAPYILGEYMRLYSGVDGTMANGMKYGGFVEVRQNASSATIGNPYPGAISASGQTGNNSLIFRSAHAYVGGPWGQFRFGQTYSALGTFLTGTMENFDDGAWDGDLPSYFQSTDDITWPFDENSGVYGMSKLVYLSPRIAGFDVGFSWQPYTESSGQPQCANASAACPNLIAAGTAAQVGQLARNTNLTDLVGRYTGTFGPWGVVATIGGAISGVTANDGIVTAAPTGVAGAHNGGGITSYKNVVMVDTGAQVSFGGLMVAGHLTHGKMNGNGSNDETPVASGYPDQTSWTGGVSYAWGPFIVGGSWIENDFAGAYGTQYAPTVAGAAPTKFGLRQEQGLALGGTMAYAPGALLFVSYLYGTRHQAGYNFFTDTRSTSFNQTRAQGVLIGNTFKW